MIRLEILNDDLDELDEKLIRYANDNLKEIIRVLIDFLEDDNEVMIWDVIPKNTNSISGQEWIEMVYDLYNMVSSSVLRDYIKPKYQYLLYQILGWWQECFEDDMNLLMVDLDEELAQKISLKYPSENINDENYILKALTNYDEYFYIFFQDHDFLPDMLEKMVIIYLRVKSEMFAKLFPDVELDEFRDLMPRDLKELYDECKTMSNNDNIQDIENVLCEDIMFCCEKVQSDFTLKDAGENSINDRIRDLLEAMGYDIKDQTRHGLSARGKDAGNIDILIKMGKFPIAILEALKVTCFREKYILEHINRIYKYDTLGLKHNFLIIYVKDMSINEFFERYVKCLQKWEYPYKVININEDNQKQYPEIRTIKMILDREGIQTKLYHFIIRLVK